MPNSRVNGIRGRQELRNGQRERLLCTENGQRWDIERKHHTVWSSGTLTGKGLSSQTISYFRSPRYLGKPQTRVDTAEA